MVLDQSPSAAPAKKLGNLLYVHVFPEYRQGIAGYDLYFAAGALVQPSLDDLPGCREGPWSINDDEHTQKFRVIVLYKFGHFVEKSVDLWRHHVEREAAQILNRERLLDLHARDIRAAHEIVLQYLLVMVTRNLKVLLLRYDLKYFRRIDLASLDNRDRSPNFVHAIEASGLVRLQFLTIYVVKTLE